jgi:hypothetical protein
MKITEEYGVACSSEVAECFEGTYCLQLQGERITQVRKRQQAQLGTNTLRLPATSGSFLLCLFFDPEKWGDMFLRSNELSQNYTALQPRRLNSSVIFIVTAEVTTISHIVTFTL